MLGPLPLSLLIVSIISTVSNASPHSSYGFTRYARNYFHFKSPHYAYSYYPSRPAASFRTPRDWSADWEAVSEVFSPAPPSKLDIKWENSRYVKPGDRIPVTVMGDRPSQLRWQAERGALYTVMLLDAGIGRVLPKMYAHWMVKDVPANNIKNGVEVMQYVTPFSLEFNEAGELVTDPVKSSHPLIMVVFKQKSGKIIVDEAQQGCGPDIASEGPRILDYRDLVSKYDLELVAGNYLYMPYSGYATHDMICRISKCTRQQWPIPMPGINDLEECQPRQDIVDATTRGPIKGKEAQYNKYASEFSSDSITNLVKETYPVLSTGKGQEYRAIEGAFNGPFVDNLAETLDGVIDTVFFNYPSKEAAEKVFYDFFNANQTLFPTPNKTPIFQRLAPLFESIYFPPLGAVLATPDDQDFDVENIAEGPGWVFDMLMVRINEGDEEKFREVLPRFKARMLNIKDVEHFYTFTVNRDILQDPRASLPENTERIELMIANHVSYEARKRAFAEISQTPVFAEWGPLFSCVVCPLLREITGKDYLPPYNN